MTQGNVAGARVWCNTTATVRRNVLLLLMMLVLMLTLTPMLPPLLPRRLPRRLLQRLQWRLPDGSVFPCHVKGRLFLTDSHALHPALCEDQERSERVPLVLRGRKQGR